ncbi:hypothetical protein QR680_016348 [Steinernema hermaphroditum]|uniref:Uncharacterized protein n=1 Tax=Steinernema hermaphroditum TaxID=289476 RepID=A0AA39LLV4_9BILA|nr:hypothetical protein QR680_016348 [Steinernema hermaphroditum]
MNLPRADEEVMVRGEGGLGTEFAGGRWRHRVDGLCLSESAKGSRFGAVGFEKVAEDSVLGGAGETDGADAVTVDRRCGTEGVEGPLNSTP